MGNPFHGFPIFTDEIFKEHTKKVNKEKAHNNRMCDSRSFFIVFSYNLCTL